MCVCVCVCVCECVCVCVCNKVSECAHVCVWYVRARGPTQGCGGTTHYGAEAVVDWHIPPQQASTYYVYTVACYTHSTHQLEWWTTKAHRPLKQLDLIDTRLQIPKGL